MPLLYGEGRKAFIRLSEEIFGSTDDQSLLAWNVPFGSELCWELGSVFSTSPLDFLDSGNIVSYHEELEAQVMSRRKDSRSH